MKKAITILAILAIVVGAVFADETHTLKIKATQQNIEPAFQMYVKAVTQTGATKDSTIITNPTAVKYDLLEEVGDGDEEYDSSASEAATFSFELANTVTVAVKLGNAAKTAQNYLLTFKDGVFNVKKNGAATHKTGVDETTGEDIMTGWTVEPSSKMAAAGANSDAVNGFTTAPSTNTATVDFNGTTCTIGHEIATCDFAYAAHTDVDPGTYFANVVLTIETSN